MKKLLMMCLLSASFLSADDLKKAQDLRESGKTLEAIDLYNQMVVEDQKANDYYHMINALTGRMISWRHLFIKTKEPLYAILVEKEAEAIQEIVKTYQLRNHDHLVHYLLAQAAVQKGEYAKAAAEYKLAVNAYPGETAEKGDWLAHLGNALCLSGKKEEGKEYLLKGISHIKEHASEIDSFVYNVWVSGAYLRLYENLQSEEYLTKAREIIDSDPRLVVRKQQLP